LGERFLLDENVPSSVIQLLKKKGFEAKTVLEVFGPGSSNGRIVDEASRSGETIITLDSDFLKLHPSPKAKILLIDVHPAIPSMIGQALESHFAQCILLLKSSRKVRLTQTGPTSSA
jgi:predicted nuclease of predicted toxin-antitoxin system